jgi:hypothetical protein
VLWNGSSFRTRAMRKITPPNNWKEALPPINIQGELWFVVMLKFVKFMTLNRCEDRDMCRRAVLAGRPSVSGWKGLTFIAYDLPDQKHLIFSERIKLLKQLIDKEKYPRALIPNFIECEGEHHLQKLRLDKFNESGSGMLLFNPSHSIEFPQVLYVTVKLLFVILVDLMQSATIHWICSCCSQRHEPTILLVSKVRFI